MDIDNPPRGEVSSSSREYAFETEHARVFLILPSAFIDDSLAGHLSFLLQTGIPHVAHGLLYWCIGRVILLGLLVYVCGMTVFRGVLSGYNQRSSCPWFLDPVTACMSAL
jgi:hypothetical protein